MMFSIYNIKPKFQKLLNPALVALNRLGVSPNHISIAAIFVSFSLGLSTLLFTEKKIIYIVLPIGLLFRMILNALDGMMARQYNKQTKLGEVLNEFGDILSDLFIVLPFAFVLNVNPIYVVLLAIGALINEFSGILAKAIKGERRYDGPMGKSDRAFLIGIISLMLLNPETMFLVNLLFLSAFLGTLFSTYLRIKNSLI